MWFWDECQDYETFLKRKLHFTSLTDIATLVLHLQVKQEPTQVEDDAVYHPSLAFASKARAYPMKHGAVYQPYLKTLQTKQEPTQVEEDAVYPLA